jgi:hypothetical protein
MFDGKHFELRERLDLTSLVTKLKDLKVITVHQERRIQLDGVAKDDRVGTLISFLEQRPDSEWETFCTALHDTGQSGIVAWLTVSSVSPDSSSLSAGPETARLGELEADIPRIGEVKVVHTTEDFYKAHKSEAYPMSYRKRGIACIINVKKTKGENDREGTDIDRDNLEKLFTQMHFTVKCYNDSDGLNGDEIIQKIKYTADLRVLDGKHPQCYILFILSHGDTIKGVGEVIYGNDGISESFSRQKVLDVLKNSNLDGIPRLVCFVACRGLKERKYGVEQADSPGLPDDCIMGLPCEEGYQSIRNTKYGTRYVRCFVDLFMKKAWNTDVESLLQQMNDKLSEGLETGKSHQIAEHVTKLKKKLYLFPGHRE